MAKVKTVQVGKLRVQAYAAEKPVALGAGGKFVTLAEAAKQPAALKLSLASLDDDDQVKLVLERNRLEPEFSLGVIGYQEVNKGQLLDHIQQRTWLGMMAIQAELTYVEELVAGLGVAPKAPKEPKLGAIKAEPVPKQLQWLAKAQPMALQSCALFCENTTDSVTKLAAAYRKKYVHPVFAKRGFRVIVLEGIEDVAAKAIPLAKNARVVYISGIGHGNPTTYTGHLNSPIFVACQYPVDAAKKKCFHLLSCQTAKQLGPDTVNKGAKAYAGYYENFTFVITPASHQELFWKCDSTYDLVMAVGKPAKDATSQTIAAYNAAIQKVPGTAAATWLTWDRNYLRTPVSSSAYGDLMATISPHFGQPLLELEEALAALAPV